MIGKQERPRYQSYRRPYQNFQFNEWDVWPHSAQQVSGWHGLWEAPCDNRRT